MEEIISDKKKSRTSELDKKLDKFYEWVYSNWNLLVLGVFLLAMILRLKYLFVNQALWFDEAVYMSQAKSWVFDIGYTMSYVRPFLMPMIGAVVYFLGGGETFMRLIILGFSLSAVYLTYLIGKEMFDKKIGLIAMFLMSISYLYLFYTARILVGIPATMLWLLGTYLFWKGYVNGNNPKFLLLLGPVLILSILMRFPAGLLGIVIVLYLLITDKFKFLKKKEFWYTALFGVLMFIPYSVWYYKVYDLIPIIGPGSYYKYSNLLADGLMLVLGVFQTQVKALSGIPFSSHILMILFLIGFVMIIFNLFMRYDMVTKDKKAKRNLFIFLWIISNFIYFTFFASSVEDRYYFFMYPAMFLMIGYALVWVYKKFEKFSKVMSLGFVILLLLIAMVAQLNYAGDLITMKSSGYVEFKYAGEWMKERMDKDDYTISSGVPMVTYYSEHFVDGNWGVNESEFEKKIQEGRPKYMVISAYEGSPDYTYNYPEYNDFVIPVHIEFFDAEKTQAAVVVYELDWTKFE